MDVLRCQSPEMVRMEIWAHLLAYNLVRGLMAQAARASGLLPREVSFAGALSEDCPNCTPRSKRHYARNW